MTSFQFRPMLADKAPADLHALRFPLLTSPKLDGVRAIVRDGVVVSRKLKPIPNATVQEQFGESAEGLDGELIFGDPRDPDCFRKTTSAVMSRAPLDPDDLRQLFFYVFDRCNSTEPFKMRYAKLENGVWKWPGVKLVPHRVVTTVKELIKREEEVLKLGYEGLMLRDPLGPYKYGRSTLKEGWLLKLKRFEDGEAHVFDVEELEHNDNTATVNALGLTERSHKKANRRGSDMLGALKVRDVKTGVEFNIGTGFTMDQRQRWWAERDVLIGKIARYRYFPTGSKEKPRFPRFAGWRDPLDMSED